MGLVGLARSLASEFPAHNIRVNAVSPGSLDTTRTNPQWDQGRAPNAAGIPLRRRGTVEEIAATCLYLVGDDDGFITCTPPLNMRLKRTYQMFRIRP
jgi:3-oxoacyl-[acyl-carrier protein] reductase